MQLDSQELADCLDLSTGLYYIKPAELNKAVAINYRSLIPPMRRRLRTKRTIARRYIKTDDLAPRKAPEDSQPYVVKSDDGGDAPRYVINPDLLDPSSSVIVQGLDGATAGHLVLVSENGELLLQCDTKDFPQMSRSDTAVIAEAEADEVGHGPRNTLYIVEDDNDNTDLAQNL